MPLPRRSFLRDGLSFALSAGLMLSAARTGLGQKTKGQMRIQVEPQLGIPMEAQMDPVFLFTRATFDPYVGGFFQAPNARGEMVTLQLLSVSVNKPSGKLTKRTRASESFSLMFKASSELPPFTSIHTVSHPALGSFDLFLTPRKTETGDLFYEGVFNHIR